ncbi:hypothetical protein DFH27DRAFT_131946 [Peziza echinospora]|nr:hypothetical protein DFH27DRAFT_131946 [Peziza echinospora]
MGKSHLAHHQNRAAPPQTPPSRSHLMHRYSSKDALHYLPPMAVPRTPSPPSSPPEMELRTPMLSGGSSHPWDRSYRAQHMSPLTPQPFPTLIPRTATRPPSSPQLPQGVASSFPSETDLASQEPELTSATTVATSSLGTRTVATPQAAPLQSTPYSGHQYILQEETWQTLYPSEIAAFDTPTLRTKLSQSNALLTKLSSSLSEARTKAAHYMFQHRLLTIETNEAIQRHHVESEMAKREVEILRKDGPGAAGVQHRCELEDAIDLYKKRLRRAKMLLRDAREEALEVRQENEMLKKRIRENRQHRLRDMEANVEACPLRKEEEEEDEGNEGDAKFDHSFGPATNGSPYYREVNHSSPSMSRQPHLHQLLSSPGLAHGHNPQTPRAKALEIPNQNGEDALTTLGLLASQVLSQEGLSEPQTPRTNETRLTPRSTTPIREISRTVPSTPLSQARNHPGTGARTPLPQTPRRRNGVAQTPSKSNKDGNLSTVTPGRKALGAVTQYGTPAYTSPAISSSATKKSIANGVKVLVPESPLASDVRGKKRRLSTESTLSATNVDDEVDSLNESDIEEVIKDGSPTPQITRTGRVLSNGHTGFIAQKAANRFGRFNKRTRGELGGLP